ncbi:MAG: tetratricopeptide repeat protein [Candidatus Aminicenantes bacterium]|nr:tetratricopeptide repeat protein [Candidatus Aminicenantes bacterium]
MNQKKVFFMAVVLVMGVSLLFSGLVKQESAKELFERAIYLQETRGDLEAAMEVFQRIVKEFPHEREIAAKAQLQIGICLQKLGMSDAQKAFQAVVDRYPDQTETVKSAIEKLSLLMRAQTIVNNVEKEFKLREIWAGSEASNFVSPSPDGRFLSIMDRKTGNLGIREISSGKTRLLTKEADWANHFVLDSLISPDGDLVVYSWYTYDPESGDYSYSLHLIGIDGSGHRVLYFNNNYEAYPESWSSDGKQIVARLYDGKTGECSILLVTVSDGSSRILKEFGKPLWLNMCYSSDNRYVVYDHPVEEDSGNRNISMVAVDGSGEFLLIKHPANDHLLGWVPGGDSLLFLSDRDGSFDAYLVEISDHSTQGSPQLIRRSLGEVKPLGFTRDGSFFFSLDSRWASIQISTFDMDTGKIQVQPVTPILGNNLYPQWSPKGDKLAYIKERNRPDLGFRRTLQIRNLKTGEERELAGHLDLGPPCWSSDGRFILTRGRDSRKKLDGYNPEIYKIDVESGESRLLIEAPRVPWGEGKSPRWSFDEKTVFYMKENMKERKIMKYDLDSGSEKEFFSHPDLATAMDISPDGKYLVTGTCNYEKDSGVLLLMPVSGGEAEELCTLNGFRNSASIDWMPDGKHVIYSEINRKDEVSLWKIAIDGGTPLKIWQGEKNMRGLSIHPDGKRIAFSTSAQEQEIWAMDNYLPKTKNKK